MENIEDLILDDEMSGKIYWEQQCVMIDDLILKFEEINTINNKIRKRLGKVAGRKQRKMPKGFSTLLEKGLSYNELTKVYNCSKTTISRWKKELQNKSK